VKYDTNQITTTAMDKNGTFTVTLKVSASEGGNPGITFTDGTHTPISLDFSMDSAAPQTPTLLSPASSSKASKTPTLKWQDVTDPSGIIYSLQIANDATFTILGFQKDGLKSSEYTLISQDIWEL